MTWEGAAGESDALKVSRSANLREREKDIYGRRLCPTTDALYTTYEGDGILLSPVTGRETAIGGGEGP